jgi:hypothetical protein
MDTQPQRPKCPSSNGFKNWDTVYDFNQIIRNQQLGSNAQHAAECRTTAQVLLVCPCHHEL